MHENLLKSDDIDHNLYPALLEVFVLIFIGYLAASFQLLSEQQLLGLNKFVGTFALPALLFKNTIVLDFSSVNWLFLLSIFLSKAIVFAGTIVITLLTIRPINIGLAGVLGIYVSQSNDFALGFPIVSAVYGETHPDYLNYIYLIAPISLCILNPIAFLMMEANEVIYKSRMAALDNNNNTISKRKSISNKMRSDESTGSTHSIAECNVDSDMAVKADDDEEEDEEDDDDELHLVTAHLHQRRGVVKKTANAVAAAAGVAAGSADKASNDLDEIIRLATPRHFGVSASTREFKDLVDRTINDAASGATGSNGSGSGSGNASSMPDTCKLVKITVWSTLTNPIVFMTLIGIAFNFILHQKIPFFIEPILTSLSNTFSALALFFLGYTMVGKIKGLTFKSIVTIVLLIFTKSIIFPLITRELVLHLNGYAASGSSGGGGGMNGTMILSAAAVSNETEALSTFGFLYGTFPAAPSLFFYIARYKSIGDDLISSALVFGTLASAPLMMISGKMISLNYNDSSAHFEDIECKTAFGFSILTWFCCLWVLYVFLASGRLHYRSHRYTVFLIAAQMFTALIHIVWSNLSTSVDDLDTFWGYAHVVFGLFGICLTRCGLLAVVLNFFTLGGVHKLSTFSRSPTNCWIYTLARFRIVFYLIGLGLPVFFTTLCMLVSGIPEKQTMMISVGKPQLVILNCMLVFLIVAIFYLLIEFARIMTNNENNLLTFIANFKSLPSSAVITSSFTNSSLSTSGTSRANVARASLMSDDLESGVVPNGGGSTESNRLIKEPNEMSFLAADNQMTINYKYQLIAHVSLTLILTFTFLLCLFFQMWILFDESRSGIFLELKLLDITLLYGQGFFSFLAFGLDNDLIFAPALYKIKKLLRLVPPFKLVALDDISPETRTICERFRRRYAAKCAMQIVTNQRFHHKFYRDAFKGSDLVEWLLVNGLISERQKCVDLGNQLIQGRVIAHVTNKRAFFDDGFNFYRFNA